MVGIHIELEAASCQNQFCDNLITLVPLHLQSQRLYDTTEDNLDNLIKQLMNGWDQLP